MVTIKRIQRSAVIDETPVAGNLVKVRDPKALSLVGSPSNQTPFRVIRSEGDSNMSGKAKAPTTAKRSSKVSVRRVVRSGAVNPIMRLTFPEACTEDHVNTILDQYGMQDGYNVTQVDGLFMATRSDLQSIAKDAIEIPLTPDGIVAHVSRTDAAQSDAEPVNEKLILASVDIDFTKVTRADAIQWLKDNGIDAAIADDAEAVTITRSELPEETETRAVEVEPGISLNIARDDGTIVVEGDILVNAPFQPIPEGYVAVVNETLYGNWGWGHMDFNAAVADEVYSKQVRAGLDVLDNVLREIMFWSPLPIASRKLLVNNALSQFATFVNGHMDMLPRQVLISVSRSDKPSGENEMKNPAAAATTTRNDAASGGATAADSAANTAAPAAAATNEAGAGAAAAGDETVTLKRSELDGIVQSAATAAANAALAAITKRGDETAKEGDDGAAAAAAAGNVAVGISRSDLTAALGEALKPLTDRLEAVEGKTVVRNDAGDAAAATQKTTKRNDGDVFAGSIPGISRKK